MTKSCFYEAKENVPPAIKEYKYRGNSSNLVSSHFGCPQLKELESGIAPLIPRGFYPTCWGLNHPLPSPKDLQTTETCKLLANYLQTTCKLLQTTCKLLANYLQTTCKLLANYLQTNYLQTTCKLLAKYLQKTCNIRHRRIRRANSRKESLSKFTKRWFFFATNFPTKVGWCVHFGGSRKGASCKSKGDLFLVAKPPLG